MVLEKTLESPFDCKGIQPAHPKGDQSWVFIGRTDAESETPILWPPDAKNWLIGKDPDAGRDWVRRRRRWQRMRWLNGITDLMDMSWVNSRSWWWQGSLACCDSWGRKESDMTERLNCSHHGFTFCSHKPAWISAQFGWLVFTSIFNFSWKRACSDPLGYLESRMHMGIWYIIISTNSFSTHNSYAHK